MNKKGNVIDIIFAIVVLFVVGIITIASFNVLNIVTNSLNSSDSISDYSKNKMNELNNSTPIVWDYIYFFIFFGTFIGIIAMAYLIRSNSLFFILAVLLIAVFGFVSAILSNVYFDMLEGYPALADFVGAKFYLLDHLMTNYPLYIAAMGFLVLIAMFAKANSGDGMF